jgi:sec-independent protein translocase protein TatB
MLDFGWAELLIIVAVAVFVVGPKDIPKIMYGLGRLLRRVQYIKYAVSQQFDDIMNTGDIEELRKGVNFEAPRSKDDIAHEQAEDEAVLEGNNNDKPSD